jgi:hypothetical protein
MRTTSASLALGGALALAAGCGGGGSASGPPNPDAGGDGPVADAPVTLACPPAALGSWQPPPYRHASPVQPTACTAALIADFYASCLGPMASAAACDASWGNNQDATHQTCQSCLVTPVTAATWGAVVQFGSGATVSLNVGGCIELLDANATGGVACATSVQQADECEHKACDATCPVTDDASFADWKACIAAASAGACAAYTAAAGCARSELDAGPAARCISGAAFQDQFTAIASVFCD